MKKLFLFMLVLFVAGLAFADTVVVGTGTQVSRFPLGSFYGYERSAALYTDTELGAQNSRISEIAWYTNTVTSVSVPTKIYLKTTTSTTLTNATWATMINGATLVYDATHTGTVAGGWNSFVFSSTFDVDDGLGLIVLVERNYGGGGNGSSSGAGVNATDYTGGHLYWNQDNSAPTGNGYTSSTRPNVTITYTTYTISGPPNNALISSPADGATGVTRTATLNWASGGGMPTGYKLSFGTDNPPTNIVNNADLGNVTTYDPNPDLAYSTTYYWKIVAYNSYGDATGASIWSFTTMADPTQPLPYTQDFNSGTSLAAINWTGDMSITANHGTDGSNGLNRNLWSNITTCNAVTPPIGPMTNGVELKFDYRIVNWSSYPNNATVLGANDNIQVQISTDNGTNYSTIHTINQANHVTSTSFATITVPLTAYTSGNIMLKFVGNWGVGDYYVDFDNVIVRVPPTGPPAPVTINLPANGTTGLPIEGFNIAWTPDATGGAPAYYTVYLSKVEADIYNDVYFETTGTSLNPATYTGGPSNPIVFDYLDRWYFTVQAVNNDGDAVVEPAYWFEIQSDPTIVVTDQNQWLEGYESATFPPTNWTSEAGSGSWTYTTAASGYGTGTGSALADFYNINGSTPFSLVTPPLDISAVTDPILMFDHAYATYSGEEDQMDVYYSTDGGASYTLLLAMPGGENGILNTGGTVTSQFVPTAQQWNTQVIQLPAGTNKLKFTATSAWGNGLYLDNINVCNRPVFHDLTMLQPTGDGTVVPSVGVHSYIENTGVNLTGNPGLSFLDRWEVDGVQYSTNHIAQLTMDANHQAQAFFSLPAGALAEDFNMGAPTPGEWTQTSNAVSWEAGDDTFFFSMFDSYALIGQVATDPEEMLITPEVVLNGSINKLGFWLAGGNNVYGFGSSTVQVKHQIAGSGVWTNLGSPIDLANDEGPLYICQDLSALPNGTYKFAFAVSSTFSYGNYKSWVGIDNVVGPVLASVSMNDLAVTKVSYPNEIIYAGNTAVLSATVKNLGLNPQTGTLVTFTVNDGRTVLTANVTGTLNYNETQTVTVNYTTVGGRHTITASVPADDILANNSASTQGVVAVTGNLAEGFEGAIEGWTVSDPSYWTINNIGWLPPYEGAWSAYCLGGTFTDDRLVTPKVILTGTEELNFYASFGNQSVGAASLAVDYSTDGATWTNILPAFAPTETNQLYTVDLSTIPAGEYYLAFVGSGTTDGQYNTILNVDHVIGPELAIVALDAPNVTIALVSGAPQLTWDPVDNAVSYKVYASADPYGTFTLLGSTASTIYDLTGADNYHFYYVIASTDARQAAAPSLTGVPVRKQMSANASQAPQITTEKTVKPSNINNQRVIIPKK